MGKNFKGSTSDRQIKDAMISLDARNTSKKNDGMTYGNATATTREQILRDLADLAAEKGLEGKLNAVIDGDLAEMYLEAKLAPGEDGKADWSKGTAESRISTMQSMFNKLGEQGYSVGLGEKEFDRLKDLADLAVDDMIENRYIPKDEADRLIERMGEQGETHRMYGEIARETGFRDAEIRRLMESPGDYIVDRDRGLEEKDQADYIVDSMLGKNSHEYGQKSLSPELGERLKSHTSGAPEHSSLHKSMGEHSPHDFRFTYARDEFDSRIEQGMSYEDALAEVSKELNHLRPEITEYYLQRTEG